MDPKNWTDSQAILSYLREGFAIGFSRRKYGASFKPRVELEAMRENKTIHPLASQYGIYLALVTSWRKEMLTGAERVFSPEDGEPTTRNKSGNEPETILNR